MIHGQNKAVERFTTTQKCSNNDGKKSMDQTCTIWLLNFALRAAPSIPCMYSSISSPLARHRAHTNLRPPGTSAHDL